MTIPEEEVWLKLSRDTPSGSEITARPAFPNISEVVLAAIDSSGHRHFLIPILASEDEISDNESRGINVNTNYMRTKGTSQNGIISRYIDIMCVDRTGFDQFNLIGRQITEAVSADVSTKAEAVRKVLTRWRYFWGKIPKNILSKEQTIGLFSELWFMKYWLFPRLDKRKVIESWSGPRGGRHDFEFPNISFEVKGTTIVEGRIHWIHGLDQLLPPEDGELLFFSLKLREENGGVRDLPEMVRSCGELLNEDLEVLDQFESALSSVGYSPAHDSEYEKLKFRVVDEMLYNVDANFPKITNKTLLNGHPTGVERVKYQINLDGFESCIVARRPENFDLKI